MPELPEVESVRRQLHAAIVGHVIARAQLIRPDYLTVMSEAVPPNQASSPKPTATPHHLLQSHRITTTSRKGKQLAIHTAEGPILLLQLGMSGEVQIHTHPTIPTRATDFPETASQRSPPTPDSPLPTPVSKHTHATLTLDNHTLIHFTDPRRFGHLTWFPSLESLHHHRWNHLGPDALTITPHQLAAALASTTRHIKAALLDQSLLAGVGNIYADEALHLAHLHPKRPAHRLTPSEVERLTHAVVTTLEAAVRAGGSTISTYRSPAGDPGNHQVAHRVYARAGQPCLTCTAPLRTDTIAQRTTVWCPNCQPYRPAARRPVPTIHTRFTSRGQISRPPDQESKSRAVAGGLHSS